MDSLPAGHLCLSGAITSLPVRPGADVGRALRQHFACGVRRVSALVMSHFHKLFIDRLRGIISQCSLSVLSTRLLCFFAWKWWSLRLTPAVQSVTTVSKERNEAYNKGSEVLVSVNRTGTSFILFQISLASLQMTFSSGWCGKVNSFWGTAEEWFCSQKYVCVRNRIVSSCLLKFHTNSRTLSQSAQSHFVPFPQRLAICLKRRISGGEWEGTYAKLKSGSLLLRQTKPMENEERQSWVELGIS